MLFIKCNNGRLGSRTVEDMRHQSIGMTSIVEYISVDGAKSDYVKARFGKYSPNTHV